MFRSIAKNLIPSNFKENQVINDVIDIFVDYIYENSNLVLDINNLYSEKNEILFEELLKIYAANFYKTITDGSKNHKLAESVKRAHEKWGINFDSVKLDIAAIKLLTKNELELFKNFQQTKGTLRSIEFIYHIIEQLNIESYTLETDGQLVIRPGNNVFEYIVEGSMLPEIFEAFVKPLAHPVGWVYLFIRTYSLFFTDYFLSQEIYDVDIFKVECSDDRCSDDFKLNEGYIFETDQDNKILFENGKPKKYKAIKKPVINVTRFGINYSELILPSEICLVEDPSILTIEKTNIKGDECIKIYFKSGEYLEQHSNPKSLILYYGKGPNDLKQIIKKDYTAFLDSCALHLSYKRTVVTTIKDLTKFQIDFGFVNTVGNISAIGAGNLFVGSRSWILGEKYLQNNASSSYKTRISDKFLRTTDYNALYKINNNKIRPLFTRVESGFLQHIKCVDLNLYKKDDEGFYYYIAPKNSIFLDCINKNDTKININVELLDDTFIIKSDIQNINLIYWTDYLEKTRKYQITPDDIKINGENSEIGRYYIELTQPVIGVFKNNIKVSCDIFLDVERHRYIVYVDELSEYTILCIDDDVIDEKKQLESKKIVLNKDNNFTVELDLNECFIIGFYNNSKKRINFKYVKNIITNEFDKIIINSDLVSVDLNSSNTNDFYLPNKTNITEVTLRPYFSNVINLNENSEELNNLESYNLNTTFNNDYEIHAEIFYLKNISEPRTIVYFENHRIDSNDLPLEISLNTSDMIKYTYVADINELDLEQNILKLYFDLDVRDIPAQLSCFNEDSEILEKLNFTLTQRITANEISKNLYVVEFEAQLQKSYNLWRNEVYKRDSNLDYSNYVGWFSTNDTSYDSKFIGVTDKLEYKLHEVGNSGLIAIDTFDVKSFVKSTQTEVIFEFTDYINNIKDNINISNVGYYQNKYGWQNLYVDKFLEQKYLPLFNEIIQLNDLTSSNMVDVLDDYYVPKITQISHLQPKIYPVYGLLGTNDYYEPRFNELNIKNALIYFVNSLDKLPDYLIDINKNKKYTVNKGSDLSNFDDIRIQSLDKFHHDMVKNGQLSTLIDINKISDVYINEFINRIK